VLDLIERLRAELRTSVLFISHSLAVIGRMCDRIGVLYAGELVEEGAADETLSDPRHPYTVALLRCVPKLGQSKSRGRLETIAGFLPTPDPSRASVCSSIAAAMPPTVVATGHPRRRCSPADWGSAWHAASTRTRTGTAASCRRLSAGRSVTAAARRNAVAAHAQSLQDLPGGGPRIPGRARGHDRALARRDAGPGGESGSGKSSLAKLLLGLSAPDAGSAIELSGSH